MIGLFDSGLGGLSVLAAVARSLPHADLTYFADTACVPYGSKSEAFIRARVLGIGEYLVEHGCKLLVVACNTATVAAVHALRERFPTLPIVGIEPGIKPAAASSRTGRIAVLATEATARSARLATLIQEHAKHVEVLIEPCPGWATRVETLQLSDASFATEIAARIQPLLDAGADRIVLGCTHYSFLAPLIAPLLQDRAELVEVSGAVARQCSRLAKDSADYASHGEGRLKLLSSAHPERLEAALPALGLSWLKQKQVTTTAWVPATGVLALRHSM